MSLVDDSPVHSSSSDDLAGYLEVELDSDSMELSLNEEAEEEEAEEEEAEDEESKDEEAEDDTELKRKRMKMSKVESSENIQGHMGSTSHATLEAKTEVFLKTKTCPHPGTYRSLCICCGEKVEEQSGVNLGYIQEGLRLENDELVRLRNTDMKNLLRLRKLYLVLDLDHTLLNSTVLRDISPEEEYLNSQADSLQDISRGSLFRLDFMHMMTKLRPFVRTFLKEASEMFEMYIYTMGDRPYANQMANLLDPSGEYFSGRVISRDDGTLKHQKGLDVVLGEDSAVLILDDTESAWEKHRDNLILMERYHFFASSCRQFGYNCKSLSQMKSDESEPDGALASVLKALKQIHNSFFNEVENDLAGRDVRQVLKMARKEILKGCKIVFSRVFPTKFQAENHHLWKIAEQLGATCVAELDPSVTHVVSTDAGTEKSRWAVKQKKFLVHPRWIEAANYLWQKHPEENFPVKQTTKDQ